MKTTKNLITVGDIFKATPLTRQGIYFYLKQGLIKPKIDTGKIKLFSKDTIDLILKIQELKKSHHLKGIKAMIDKGEI